MERSKKIIYVGTITRLAAEVVSMESAPGVLNYSHYAPDFEEIALSVGICFVDYMHLKIICCGAAYVQIS